MESEKYSSDIRTETQFVKARELKVKGDARKEGKTNARNPMQAIDTNARCQVTVPSSQTDSLYCV